MTTLLIPFIIIFAPFLMLLLVLPYLNKKRVSGLLKTIAGFVFISIGIITTYWAITMAMDGLSEKGVKCMTGVAVFIPLGFLVNIVGIPLLLIFYKGGTRNVAG